MPPGLLARAQPRFGNCLHSSPNHGRRGRTEAAAAAEAPGEQRAVARQRCAVKLAGRQRDHLRAVQAIHARGRHLLPALSDDPCTRHRLC